MSKLPILKPRQIIRALDRAGFYLHHQTGSHARFLHGTRPELRVTVPVHSKDVPLAVLKRILKQASLTEEDFMGLL
jgi:predicted RNA binding protein YcfA (HicA-like mRNA interferase family)